ncbi:hypothetical protein DFQ26_003486 [Actinomortierella ambigua]|nr:hypothetical protein DFQ26_003486 [Actinomortierella ambigua]
MPADSKTPSHGDDASHSKTSKSNPVHVAQLRQLVLESLEKCTPCDCILLSGGVDTSILAEAAHWSWRQKQQASGGDGGESAEASKPIRGAVTVLCTDQATDEFYAAQVSKRTGMVQEVVKITLENILEELEFCIKTLETFDPMELRNGIVIARGLSVAKSLGYNSVMTGDGADELFAGYSFLHNKTAEDLDQYSRKLVQNMRFSAKTLAAALGLTLYQPFLDPKLIEFSLGCSRDEKINTHHHSEDRAWQDRLQGDMIHGKFILREAFEDIAFAAWRRKEPIEVGSGTTVLPKEFARTMDPQELERDQERIFKERGIKIRDAEHLQYYRVFEKVFGTDETKYPEKLKRDGRDPCPGCGFNLSKPDQTFCVICGQWPARVLPSAVQL